MSTTSFMLYDANKKSVGVAFLLWFFLGLFGAHRFYMSRFGSAIVLLLLTLTSLVLMAAVIGHITILIPGIWWLIDAFLISGWVRGYNTNLANKYGGQSMAGGHAEEADPTGARASRE